MFDKKKDLGTAFDVGPADDDELLHHVAEDLIEAVHTQDKAGVVAALRAFLSLVEAGDLEQDNGQA